MLIIVNFLIFFLLNELGNKTLNYFSLLLPALNKDKPEELFLPPKTEKET
jgi:hypothetical protein